MSLHGKDSYFAVEDGTGTTLRNLSPYLNSIEPSWSNDIHDDTTFGQDGHTKRTGLTDGSITIGGMWDKTADVGTYTVLKSLIGSDIQAGFEYGPEGNASGKVKESGACVLESYAESAPVADLVTFTATFQVSGTITFGTFTP
jgi:hypothetical protein